jgi:hypothetical protein
MLTALIEELIPGLFDLLSVRFNHIQQEAKRSGVEAIIISN